MQSSGSLPCLPGYHPNKGERRGRRNDPFNTRFDRGSFLKKAGLDTINLSASGTLRKNLSGTLSRSSLDASHPARKRMELLSSASYGSLTKLIPDEAPKPRYIEFDKKVLRFKCYYKEAVHESPDEIWRFRKCVISWFLEDSTLKIDEIKVDNMGMMGGPFLERGRHYIDGLKPQRLVALDDILPGKEVSINKRTFRVTACDEWSRTYLQDSGYDVAPDEPESTDSYTDLRNSRMLRETGRDTSINRGKPMYPMKRYVEALLGRHTRAHGAEKRAFEFGNQTLEFLLVWNDKERLYGGENVFKLIYFLSDKTIEIRSIIQANSGVDPFPTFVTRQRIPKEWQDKFSVAQVGVMQPTDSTDAGEFYSEEDFDVGVDLNIYGRIMTIVACDSATKDYYLQNHGRNIESVTTLPELLRDKSPPLPKQEPPPHTATDIGSAEDTIGSCLRLRPKQPKRDLKKLLEFDGKTLAFHAKLLSKNLADLDRRFIIRFYLSDDSISVYETVRANSGLTGGRFMNRMRVRNESGKYFQPADFQVGSILKFNCFRFEVIGIEAWTKAYMESNGKRRSSNVGSIVRLVLEKMRQKSKQLHILFRQVDTDKNGYITFSETKKLLQDMLGAEGSRLTNADVADVMLYFETGSDDAKTNDVPQGTIDYQRLAAKVAEDAVLMSESQRQFLQMQAETKDYGDSEAYLARAQEREQNLIENAKKAAALRQFARDFAGKSSRTTQAFRSMDEDSSGIFERAEFEQALRADSFNYSEDEVQAIADFFFANGKSTLDYTDFMMLVQQLNQK
eukprot:g4960.t1